MYCRWRGANTNRIAFVLFTVCAASFWLVPGAPIGLASTCRSPSDCPSVANSLSTTCTAGTCTLRCRAGYVAAGGACTAGACSVAVAVTGPCTHTSMYDVYAAFIAPVIVHGIVDVAMYAPPTQLPPCCADTPLQRACAASPGSSLRLTGSAARHVRQTQSRRHATTCPAHHVLRGRSPPAISARTVHGVAIVCQVCLVYDLLISNMTMIVSIEAFTSVFRSIDCACFHHHRRSDWCCCRDVPTTYS